MKLTAKHFLKKSEENVGNKFHKREENFKNLISFSTLRHCATKCPCFQMEAIKKILWDNFQLSVELLLSVRGLVFFPSP